MVTGLWCRPGAYVVVITVSARSNTTSNGSGGNQGGNSTTPGSNSNSDNSTPGGSKGDSTRSIIMRPYVLAALAIVGVALLSVLALVVSARGRHKKGQGPTVASPLARDGSRRSSRQGHPGPSPRLVQVMPAARRGSGSAATGDAAPVGGAIPRDVKAV